MTKAILIILSLAGFASGAELEVIDRLSVVSAAVFSGSVGIGTAAVSGARLAVIGSTDTAYALAVGTSTNYSLTVSTGGAAQFSGTISRGTYTVLDSSMLDNFTLKLDTTTNKIRLADRIEQNIMLDAFKIAVSSSLSRFNMVDGIMDEFEDISGIDAGSSSGYLYNPGGNYYAPNSLEIDYMEYKDDADAQAAYVSNAYGNTGGAITTDGDYTVHTFTGNGIFTPATAGNVEYLAVAGGGGGGATRGGGGGAGGYQAGSLAVTAKAYAIVVGDGGNGGTYPTQANSVNGQDSKIGTDVTATGGGRGGDAGGTISGGNGGCGGGAVDSGTKGTGTQGGDGGTGAGATNYGGGGGGGAGGNGGNGVTTPNSTQAAGGAGIANDILVTGNNVTYATGGKGNCNAIAGVGAAGAANTGNGGEGGGGMAPYTGGKGGSGIVIIRCKTGDFSVFLQAHSESTIKTQGSYSLKVAAAITDSLNKTLTRTVSPTIDLTGRTQIKYDIYSSRTGGNIQIGIHDNTGSVTSSTVPYITSANSWQNVTWDISNILDANKDAVDKIIVTIVNAGADNAFYIDNMRTLPSNMILISTSFPAISAPAKSSIVLFEEDVDTCTLNTDIKASVSRDNGTTYSTATLANEGDWATGRRILSGIVDISTQPSGTNMKWRVGTSNNRDMKLHGVGLSWD